MYVQRNIKARSRKHYYHGKAMYIINYKRVSLSLPWLYSMQIASFLRSIALSHAAYLALLYFSKLTYKRYNFRKKVIGSKMRVLIFSVVFFPKYFSFWEEFSKILSRMYKGFEVKYSKLLSDFNQTNFFQRFSKNHEYQFSLKSVPWNPSCSMWKDGQTDRHDAVNRRCAQIC